MDRNLKIGIVGLGLIGGSIFKALLALKCDVSAVSVSSITVLKAKKYCPNVSKSLSKLKHCDVIFVCTPMHRINWVLDKFEKILPKKTIVADVSSLKGFVCQKKRPYQFIPSHPMAGSECAGFDNAFENMFRGAKWVLTPFQETLPENIKKITDIIYALGATPIFSQPSEHDEAVALISHMPLLVAQALFKTAQGNDLALKLASSGFRDMTRLALSSEELAIDMMSMNSQNVQQALLNLYASIGDLLSKDYPTKIREIKNERQKMYFDGKNVL